MVTCTTAAVLYIGECGTYLCDAGDVQPTYDTETVLCEELLYLMRSENRSIGNNRVTEARWREVGKMRDRLAHHLRGRHVILVAPLHSTPAFREQLVLFCFDAFVGAVSATLLADTVADCFACGLADAVVVHVSLSTVSVSRMEDGCSVKYSSSHLWSVPNLLQSSCIEPAIRGGVDSTATSLTVESLSHVDVRLPSCRADLIAAFGLGVYSDVVAKELTSEMHCITSGETSHLRIPVPPPLHKFSQEYPEITRAAAGALEKLLARMVRIGERGTCPVVLAGEGLAVPLAEQLFRNLAMRCGVTVHPVGENQSSHVNGKRVREIVSVPVLKASHVEYFGASTSTVTRCDNPLESAAKSSLPADKKQYRDPLPIATEIPTSRSLQRVATRNDTSAYIYPTPLPTAPWWLPILGGSLVAQLPDSDLSRARMTAQEVQESCGTVVHWKALW